MQPTHLLILGSLVTLTAPLAASAAQLAATPVAVRVYDSVGMSARERERALEVAAGALAAADVDVRWRRCDAAPGARICDLPPAPGELIIRLVPTAGRGTTAGPALGDAMLDRATGKGCLATIYLDRVGWLARAGSADVTRVLGYAIAHELGHLLLATGTHSEHGLMRAVWTSEDMRRARARDWQFTRREVAAIRARHLTARMAHQVWGD